MPEEETEVRIEVKILGAVLGTASGWDQYGDNGLQFQDFIPNVDFQSMIEICHVFCIDFESGEIEGYGGAYSSDRGKSLDAFLILGKIAICRSKS